MNGPRSRQTRVAVIEKLVAGGDGLARIDGQVVFVPFSLPGEEVRVEVRPRREGARKGFATGAIREILRPSPRRVEAPCPVFGVCGGCAWQHIDYAEQTRLKAGLAAEALERIGRLRPQDLPGISGAADDAAGGKRIGLLPPAPSPPYGYRNRVQLHRDSRGRLGFRKRASHAVVPIRGCPIAVPAINAFLADPAAGRPPGRDRFLVFGADDWLAVEGGAAGGRPGGLRLAGSGPLAVEMLGRRIEFQVKTFFQSNLGLLPRLVAAAVEGLAGRRALDLYCGVGLFASFLADSFEQVTAVEQNPLSLAFARRNVAGRPGARHRFHAARLEDWVRRAPLDEPLDAAVVDPPRAGLSPQVTAYLLARKPGRLVYVSCDAATLARDLARLLAGGYRLEELRLFDFYPQTAHLEAVARLSSGG